MDAISANTLENAVEHWVRGFQKDDTWTGGNNANEARIIELADAIIPTTLDCMLYRAQGVEDGLPEQVLTTGSATIEPTKRLLNSWTTRFEVARTFLEDAVECNHSALLLAVHSSRLEIVLDLCETPEFNEEAEVLVRALPLAITADDVIDAWTYDEDEGTCFRLHRCGQVMPSDGDWIGDRSGGRRIDTIPDHQPLAGEGVFVVIDREGDQLVCRRQGRGWESLATEDLTMEQCTVLCLEATASAPTM